MERYNKSSTRADYECIVQSKKKQKTNSDDNKTYTTGYSKMSFTIQTKFKYTSKWFGFYNIPVRAKLRQRKFLNETTSTEK